MRSALAALAATLVLTGCASDGTSGGGRILGETLTVYALLPDTATARQIIDGQKRALAEAGGRSGVFKVNFAADFLDPEDPEQVADTTREAIRDLQIAVAVADLDSATARTTVPLLNEAGVLHLSPGATLPGYATDPRWQPSQKRTFATLAPNDAAQAAAIADAARPPVLLESEPDSVLAAELRGRLRLTTDPAKARTVVYAGSDPDNARAVIGDLVREGVAASRILVPEALLRSGFELPSGVRALTSAPAPTVEIPGGCASRYTQLGYDAMKSVLAAIATAGERASDRRRLADTWLAAYEAPSAFELVSDAGC